MLTPFSIPIRDFTRFALRSQLNFNNKQFQHIKDKRFMDISDALHRANCSIARNEDTSNFSTYPLVWKARNFFQFHSNINV